MPLYLTGLLTGDVERFGLFPVRAASWTGVLVPGTQEFSLHTYRRPDGTEVAAPNPEIGVEARGLQQAQRALSLMTAAIVVIEGSLLFGPDLELIEASMVKSRKARAQPRGATLPGAIEACLLAARASWRLGRAYALAKLYFSMALHSTHVMDLHPRSGEMIPKSTDPVVHTRLAQAIVLAYGAVEELGLEVRATRERPSSINGQWNPPVLADLERRLRRAGHDPYESILWDLRGRKTALETARPPRARARAPWTRWPDVRDVNVALVDAIAHVSWLRSSVSAHAGKRELVRVLSAYDVANAQQVARHLLLASQGIFRLWFGSRATPRRQWTRDVASHLPDADRSG